MLAVELDEVTHLIDTLWPDLVITQDLGLGMMLWSGHHCEGETWAVAHEAAASPCSTRCGSTRPDRKSVV